MHMWAGEDHTKVCKDWCPKIQNPDYKPTTYPRQKYFDQKNNEKHRDAYLALEYVLLAERFTPIQCELIKEGYRTNANEVLLLLCVLF